MYVNNILQNSKDMKPAVDEDENCKHIEKFFKLYLKAGFQWTLKAQQIHL